MLVPRLDSAISSTISQAGVVEHQRERAPLDESQENGIETGKMKAVLGLLRLSVSILQVSIFSHPRSHTPLSSSLKLAPLGSCFSAPSS
jgi:hypothetical protein